MYLKRRHAGFGLAALAAGGLTLLSSAALANSSTATVNWFDVPAGVPATGYVNECTGASCTPATTPVYTSPPIYAEQAILMAIANNAALTIPGYGSGSPNGGFTYVDYSYTTLGGVNQAQLVFTLPSNDYLASCPNSGGGVDGTFFKRVAALTCSGSPNLNTMTVTINVSTTAGTGTAWYQLPSFTVAGNSPGLSVLANETANAGTLATFGANCQSLAASCDIGETSTTNGSGFGTGLAQVMAMSGNELSLATFNHSALVCIDVLEDQQPGTRFEQPCGGTVGAQVSDPSQPDNGGLSPTNVDGTAAGSVNIPTVNDPPCSGVPGTEPQCGTGAVSGTISSSSSPDTLVADNGTLAVGETYLLGLDGIHYYVWASNLAPHAVITVTGSCAGLQAPAENVGSVAASCALRPFTGETYIGLTAVTFDPTTGAVTNSEDPGLGVCPGEYDLPASTGNGGINNISGGAQAVWGLNYDTVNSIVLPLQIGAKATSAVPSFTAANTIYFEVCNYASGRQILGPVGGWYAEALVDCLPGAYADCTKLADGGTSPAPPSGQPADALLTFAFNGIGQLFQFTDARSDYQAYLRVVNLMQDYTDSSQTGCVAPDPSGVCQPSGAVVCKIWGDDGQNAYVTLWPSEAVTATQGETSGTSTDIALAALFAQAGFNYANNPYEFGSLLCFHNANIHLSQWWLEPNGTVVNIQ